MSYNHLDDHDLVDGILNNDKELIKHFFTEKCAGLLTYIMMNVFDGNIDRRELVSELYLFLENNDWQVFRNFQYRSSLITYITVVAVRFFQRRRTQLLDLPGTTDLNNKRGGVTPIVNISNDRSIDVQTALQKMPNERYRKVIEILDLQDVRPELLAEEMNVTVDNLYNIHRRALVQLRLVMGRKEDWV